MPARVGFTDHAKQRCKQQGIHESDVRAQVLAKVPPAAGEFKWYFEHYAVVVHYYPDFERYTVITVIGLKKMQWRKRNWNRR